MDLFHNSLINLPESTNDYISNVVQTKLPNTYGFLAVIVIFLFIFSYFTSTNMMSSSNFESGTLWLLSAALTFSIVMIIVKKLTEKDSSLTTTFYQMAFMVPPTFLLALMFWENITINQVIIFIFVALAGFVTPFSFAQCLKMADTTFIMPIQFTKLVWLSIIGYLFFQELPDYWTWIGASIIFASILFITYREAVNKNSVLKSKKVNKLISNYQ